MSDFRFRALISVVFQPLCPACSLFLFRRINDDDDDELQHGLEWVMLVRYTRITHSRQCCNYLIVSDNNASGLSV